MKRQASLFGTLLPKKQKYHETGERYGNFLLETTNDLDSIDDQIKNNENEDDLFENKYACGFNLQGQNAAKLKIKEWDWKIKPLLLSGKSGIGKSSFIKGFFTDYKIWDESFLQEDESLSNVIKNLLERKPIFNIKRCILIDCIEGFTKSELNEITKLMKRKEFYFPVIFICDDEYDFKDLKLLCFHIKLENIKIDTFKSIICNVIEKESLKIQNDMIENLYQSCYGNVRFAMNELQFLLQTRKRKLLSKESSLCSKDIKFELFDTLQSLFCGVSLTEPFFEKCNGESSLLINMVHENSHYTFLPNQWEILSWCDVLEYKNEELCLMLLFLSTIQNSKKLKNGIKQIKFTSYFEFENKRMRNTDKLKKSKESFESFFKIKI